jgi:peptide/nickel transport system permease protein
MTAWRHLRSDPWALAGAIVVVLFVLGAALAPLITGINGQDPYSYHLSALDDSGSPRGVGGGISWQHWFGVEPLSGRDLFAIVLFGARTSILVGVGASLASVVVGVVVGLVAGYFGGWVDEVLMRATDVAFGVPFLPFAMVVIAISKPSLGLVVMLIVFFLWRTTARVSRSQVLSLKTRPFVWAARAAGASEFKILFRHVAPNALPLSFLYMAIGVQSAVMLEAALSFLGFGDPQLQSWGTMLNAAFQAGAIRSAWWWVLPPGLALAMFVMGIFMITRAYEEILNPRLRSL